MALRGVSRQRSLEFVRSMELLGRLLPPPPARALDTGGGPGAYAGPLAGRGYQVHLVDPVPLHVGQARQAAGAIRPAVSLPRWATRENYRSQLNRRTRW